MKIVRRPENVKSHDTTESTAPSTGGAPGSGAQRALSVNESLEHVHDVHHAES